MKKILSASVTMLLCVSFLFSCNSDKQVTSDVSNSNSNSTNSSATSQSENSNSSSTTSDSKYQNDKGQYIVGLEPKNFEGRTFTILVRGEKSETYQSEDFTTNSELYGDVINLAVKKRNDIVKEKYNVELVVLKRDSIDNDIRTDFDTGSQLYDAVMPTLRACGIMAQDGAFLNLNELKNFDVNAPWWDKNAEKAFSIGNKLFFTTGDITILNKVCTPSMLFNKEYMTTLNLEDPYALVKNHKWTYDKMMEMAKAATSDTDGISGMTGADNWGVLSSYADALSFYGAAGQKICNKNSDDQPYFAMDEEAPTKILQKILEDMSEKSTWTCYAQTFDDPIWVTSLDAFKEGRILFRPSGFSATTKLRKSGTNFGILPMPLWNENQENYSSYCSTGEVAGIAIPTSCKDPAFSAYMVSVYACEAKNYLTPAYMEVNLKSKDVQDDESLETLKIIFDNIVYDVGEVYGIGGMNAELIAMVAAGNSNISSKFGELKGKIEEQISSITDKFESINN